MERRAFGDGDRGSHNITPNLPAGMKLQFFLCHDVPLDATLDDDLHSLDVADDGTPLAHVEESRNQKIPFESPINLEVFLGLHITDDARLLTDPGGPLRLRA